MFGSGGGWGLALNSHTLAVTLGGIAEKPAVVDGQIVPRDLLSVTLSFDHDLVDGAPAARFARRFSELIEIGYGLEKALAAD
jgi:pyruvate/2-oxoglutarate dehydrogenase complex dihydrolipoamide acyltransferase (E2) component